MRARSMAVVLVGLLLALCGAASGQAATAADSAPGSGPAFASGPASGSGPLSAPLSAPVSGSGPAAVSAAAQAPQAPSSGAVPAPHAPRAGSYLVGEQADDGAVDPEPVRCHKSKGDGQGTLPAAPSGSNQQTPPLVLAICLTPESHFALDAAHARPPVRGPAPSPPPTPVELSVLRV